MKGNTSCAQLFLSKDLIGKFFIPQNGSFPEKSPGYMKFVDPIPFHPNVQQRLEKYESMKNILHMNVMMN